MRPGSRSRLARWAPFAVVTGLLALALFAPVRNVRAERPRPVPEYQAFLHGCAVMIQSDYWSSSNWSLALGEGFFQPFGPAAGNAVACSLNVLPYTNSTLRADLVEWDPATLAPPPGSIAFRTVTWEVTSWANIVIGRFDLLPPVVTKSLANVAETPPAQLALRIVHVEGSTNPKIMVAPDGPPYVPAARALHADGTVTDLPGAHPVSLFESCGGDAASQNYRVVQCVTSTDTTLDPSPWEYVQKFRVPAASTLEWLEVALVPYAAPPPSYYGDVSIYDASGQETPPASYGTALVTGSITGVDMSAGPRWVAPFDADVVPALQANHDYWLVFTTRSSYMPMAKVLNGHESPWFQTGIGGLYRRAAASGPTESVSGRALDFRIVGTPTGTTGVGEPGPRRGAFALAISPNPARGATTIGWSGAQGTVSLDVIDARGRRVATATSDAGRWSWNGAGADGRALSAGVYFVRARDGAGHTASTRITLVR